MNAKIESNSPNIKGDKEKGRITGQPGIKKGKWAWFITISASIFVLYHILYVSDLLIKFTNIIINPQQHVGIHLGGILFFSFLLTRGRQNMAKNKLPVYDIALALIGLAIPLYYGWFYEELTMSAGEGLLNITLAGWVLCLLLLEASRRLMGNTYMIVVGLFLFYPLVSGYLPGFLFHPNSPFLRIGEFMFLSGSAIFGSIVRISAVIVIVFLLFSQLLLNSGAGQFFTDLAMGAFGRFRGGPAKMAVVASGLFGTLTGSPVGNVLATGTFTIPLMKKVGYTANYAGAVEAVASLGGILMPPVMGSAIFLLCDFTGVPYIQVIKNAVLPACLYYLALFVMVDQEAVKMKLGILSKETTPKTWNVLKRGWWYSIPLVALVLLMAVLFYSPEKSAIWASVILLLLAAMRKETRMGLTKLMTSFEQTLRAMLMVGVAMGSGAIIMGSAGITGLGINLSGQLVSMSGGNIAVLLLITAATSFIMGLGIGIIGCYVFLALSVAPALVTMGVPAISAHLFIFYWGILSYITPPVAVVAYVTAGLAKGDPFKVGWMATRLGIIAYVVPFAFVFKPEILLMGEPIKIIVASFGAILGTIGIAFGIGGTFLAKINWSQRILFILGSGITMFGQSYIMWIGVLIIAGTAVWQWAKLRLQTQAVPVRETNQN